MVEASKTLSWMVDELLKFHGKKYNEEEEAASDKKASSCKLSREEVSNVFGRFCTSGKPNWTFLLEDDTCRIPCILVNSAANVERLFKLVESFIVVRKGHMVAEKYTSKDDKPIVWLQVSVDEMFAIDVGQPSKVLPLGEAHWVQRILVVHVSTPIIISDVCAFSLVLVMTSLSGSEKAIYLWIVLSGKQLQWNLFLIPNREYDLHMTCDKNYFDECIRPLRIVVGSVRGVKAITEILHHSEMWPTMDAVDLPQNTRISLQSSLNRDKFNCKWPAAWWMSLEEALAQDGNQMTFTIWGEVVKIYDDEAKESGGCSLCALYRKSKSKMAVKSESDFMMADANFVYNPWETALRMDESLHVPIETEQDDKQYLTLSTMPDKLTRNVTLKDSCSGREFCLYIKNWSNRYYSPVFTPGVILCASMVQKRVSSSKNVYFTSCALSRFEVIGCGTSMSNIGGSCIKYGFPYKTMVKPQMKVWGVLDTWKLTKVVLSHTSGKNKKPNDRYFSASATLYVDRPSGNPVIVCVKDSNVRTLLEIPLDIWTQLIELCRHSPIEYNSNQTHMQREGMSKIDSLFHAYCSLANAEKKRFHIVCRLLGKADGYTKDLYICVDLCEADYTRLANIKDVSTFYFINLKL